MVGRKIYLLLVDELLHMAVNKFDRVAGLPLCGLLSQPDRFLTGGVSQDDIEAQRGKEGICHREELVDHQRKKGKKGGGGAPTVFLRGSRLPV